MTSRSAITASALRLLAESSDGTISTRAVCEAAGVQQPTIYRWFGDKDGLLSAAVDEAFQNYLESKRATPISDDPVADIRRGWDAHTAFALEQPHAYRLLFGTGLRRRPESVQEAHDLLRDLVARAAAAGRLRTTVDVAVQSIMAANTGVALALITRPEQYPDKAASETIRDLTTGALFTTKDDATGSTALSELAARFGALVAAEQPAALTDAETALLREWLARIGTTSK